MGDNSDMTFDRFGRSYHLRIATADDLVRAVELDEAHWVATGAPVSSLNCDAVLLELLDADRNGRIACEDVRRAIRWLMDRLADTSGVSARSSALRLDTIDTRGDEGRRILNTARRILANLEKGDSPEIALDDVRRVKAHLLAQPVSEAGVVLPEAAGDDETRQFLSDVVSATGGSEHPAGSRGVSQADLESFLNAARAFIDWKRRGQLPTGAETTGIMPLGDNTRAAYEAFTAVRAKLDQYFAQCEAAALDERFTQRMGWTNEELVGMDFDDPSVIDEVLQKAPLAPARPDRVLARDAAVNPRYAAAIEQFHRKVAEPLLPSPVGDLSAEQWRQIKDALAAHDEWARSKPRDVAALGEEKLKRCLEGYLAERARRLIAESAEAAVAMDNIRLAEKLILYQARLIDFANNFVSFPRLYDPASQAMFEMGSLVMDGRRFNFAVRVDNRAEHAKVAGSSNMYVLYVEVSRGDGGKFEVAVPVTAGGAGNLCAGKRGVFYDVTGAEHDARVVQIIENPISLREAMVAPFKRIGRLVTGKLESITSEAEKKLDASATAAMRSSAAPAEAPKQGMSASTGGLLMGAGVAVAALGSALAYIMQSLSRTPWWAILIGLGGAVLLVLVPTCVAAFFKLRKRDLSAVLEGSGWAVNARMRLTRRQGRRFTQRPSYPSGAKGTPRAIWRWVGLAIVLIAIAVAAVWFIRSRM